MTVASGASLWTAATVAALLAAAPPAQARNRRVALRHRHVAAQPVTPTSERPSATTAVPQWERDGVPGNDPFNNQLRKFSDPLGAHGGR